MLHTEHKRAAHAAKTKTSTINQWAQSTINPVMGCKVKRLDRPKTRDRRRNKPQAQASGGRIKWHDSHVPSYVKFGYLKEVNQ